MLLTRRISQVLFFMLFLALFYLAAFPYQINFPADLFLRASPLIALSTSLAAKKIIGTTLLAFGILILTFVLGRYFCGWICPLGTMMDISDRVIGKVKKKYPPLKRKWRVWKFSILILIFIAALFSLQFIWFFDPLVIMTRTMTTAIYPVSVILLEGVMNLLLVMGIFQDLLFELYDFLRETILPIEPLFFQKSVIFGLIFLGILSLNFFARRFWCRYLCPLGALFGFFSAFRLTRGIFIAENKCTACGRCQRECKMDAIKDGFRSYSPIECIECLACVSVCPTQAISYQLTPRFAREKIDVTRRRFLYSTAGGLLTLGLIRSGLADKTALGNVVRPPGALPEPEFLDRCVRCQECVKICSSTGACLQPAFLESGWEGMWTPRVVARHGYCEYNCNLCGQVCPSGAIQPAQLEMKQKELRMGTAYFERNRCIPWYRNEDCLVCEEHCPLPEKAIKFDPRQVILPNGETRMVKFPYVDESLCIGCGICVTKCPVPGPGGIFLTNALEQRWATNQ